MFNKGLDMFNFVFNVQHEWFTYIIKEVDTSVSHLLKLHLKVFANIIAISLSITTPIALMILVSDYLGI
tara:strand:- start:66 stop:272 length:207 start_codon:yes stop_codon:yes gene_type:complete